MLVEHQTLKKTLFQEEVTPRKEWLVGSLGHFSFDLAIIKIDPVLHRKLLFLEARRSKDRKSEGRK